MSLHLSPTVAHSLAVAAGGALGAVLRWWTVQGAARVFGRGFPYGTLAVNTLGSFLMGVLFVVLSERFAGQDGPRLALAVGLLGGYTTFSAFSIETLGLLDEGRGLPALLNIGLNLMLALLAAAAGLALGRRLIGA